MFYIALLLIITGILLFIYSLTQSKSIFRSADSGGGPGKPFITKKRIRENESYSEEDDRIVPRHVYVENEDDMGETGEMINYTVNDENGMDREIPAEIQDKKPHDIYDSTKYKRETENSNDKRDIKSPIELKDNENADEGDVGTIDKPEYLAGDEVTAAGGQDVKQEENPDESYKFTLFDDRSSVIDYNSSSGTIDPSLNEYKEIRRIGKGRFLLEKDGINFYLEKKLFRFDFYRITEIYTGSNYIALFIKGSNAVKLFVVDNETDLINRAKDRYEEYVKENG